MPYVSKRAESVRTQILRLLCFLFEEKGTDLLVTSSEVELKWTVEISDHLTRPPTPSNTARRFRELRQEWRDEEEGDGPNESKLRQDAGVVDIERLQHSPLILRLLQVEDFDAEPFTDPT